MKLRTLLPLTAIAALTLAGCSNNTEPTADESDLGVAPPTDTAPTEPPIWETDQAFYGEDRGATLNVTFDAAPPEDIAAAINSTNGTLDAHVIQVDVDNTNGTDEIEYYEVQFVDDQGNTTTAENANNWAIGQNEEIEAGTIQGDPDIFSVVPDNHYDHSTLPRAVGSEYLVMNGPIPENVRAVYINAVAFASSAALVPESEKDNYWEYAQTGTY